MIGSRKCSADDQYPVPPPQPTSYQHQFSMTLFPDHDNLSQYQGGYDRRQGSDVSETQRTLQYIAGGKKNSRKDSPAVSLATISQITERECVCMCMFYFSFESEVD